MPTTKNKIPNRLKDLRVSRGLSQEQLAERLGTTHATISRMESLVQRLSDRWLRKLAVVLQATPGQILGVELSQPVTYAPVIEWGAVMDVLHADPIVVPRESAPLIATNYPRLTVFALRVERQNMNVVAPVGSHLIVDYADKDLIDGKYYLISSGEELMFRRYYVAPEHFGAISTLQPPPAIVLPGPSVEILGRVVQVIHTL